MTSFQDWPLCNRTENDRLHQDENLTNTLNQESRLPAGIGVFFLALNIFLSITATLSNVLILVALRKMYSVHPPTRLLIRNLAVTDLCVGFMSQPLFAIHLRMLDAVTKIPNFKMLCYVSVLSYASSYVLCQVSIFTSTAISVDRLLALLIGLRYRHVATLWRVGVVIACFWLIALSCVLMFLFLSYRVVATASVIFGVLSLVISVLYYMKIFFRLRQHQAQVQQNVRQGQPNRGGILLNIARYKKTVYSIAWVQLALIACYAPSIFSILLIQIIGRSGLSASIVFISASTLLYLNSSLNPFLYCYTIGGVRQAVKDTLRHIFSPS